MLEKRWKLQPQECEGTYMFDGKPYMTRKIAETLELDEVNMLIFDIRKRVKENMGADYLQVFINDVGQKIFAIDNLNEEMKKDADKDFIKENNYFTIMFAEEY